MNSERWEQIARLYELALSREPAARSVFLAEACVGEPDLQREVESLLEHEQHPALIDRPAWEAAASFLGGIEDLEPGTLLGPYRIEATLGAGGMGRVFRATDTRLSRVVAVKILPGDVALDPELRTRFSREAKAGAALTHPRICTVHDVGRHHDVDFIVMECLEGETLARHLANGPLPVERAIGYAIDIASALDHAHRHGIVHRDLKPSNVMVTKTGVKLLDFGIARLRTAEDAAEPDRRLTGRDAVIGTTSYMSPEQAEGKDTDQRSDIFSFGSVVHEMLTGQPPFRGDSAASIVAGILEREPPPVSSTQPAVSPLLDHVVRRCLAKSPDERWQSAGDVMRELIWAAEASASAKAPIRPEQWRWTQRRVAGTLAGSVLIALTALGAVWFTRPLPERVETVLEIVTPPTNDPSTIAISPDGRSIVYAGISEGRSGLWLRSFDSSSARSLAGTEGAISPFWSPDNRAVAFYAGGVLQKLDIVTGSVSRITAAWGIGGAWNRDATLLIGETLGGPIQRVSVNGGESRDITRLRPGQGTHRYPDLLPDGRHFLYYAMGTPETAGVYVGDVEGVVDSPRLLEADSAAKYSPSGHVLFIRQGTLVAQPFDAATLKLTGDAFVVADRVQFSTLGQGAITVSSGGVLAYRSGTAPPFLRQLVWVDRSGKELERLGEAVTGVQLSPSLSADGTRVAIYRRVNGNLDIWLGDTTRGVQSRLTTDPADEAVPVWSPDGGRIAFSSNRPTGPGVYVKSVTRRTEEEIVPVSRMGIRVTDWSADDRLLVGYRASDATADDIWALPLDPRTKPFPLVQTPFDDRWPQFSPDGKWIAYESNESGRFEIYVRLIGGPGEPVLVSTNGGAHVRWRHDGRELFYVALDDQLMAVPIHLDTARRTVDAGTPTPLFITRIGSVLGRNPTPGPQYAVAPDGRFLMNTLTEGTTNSPITVVLNWKARPR